jgi:S-phase kinase-associated protein 1
MSGVFSHAMGENDEDIEDTNLEPNVKGAVLKRVVDFCTHYQEEPMNDIVPKGKDKFEEVVTQKWYVNFIKSLDRDPLFLLMKAANYLDIQPLLSLSVLAICDSDLKMRSRRNA